MFFFLKRTYHIIYFIKIKEFYDKILVKELNAIKFLKILKVAFSLLMVFNIVLSIVFLMVYERKRNNEKEKIKYRR
jgi:hypothetical protein